MRLILVDWWLSMETAHNYKTLHMYQHKHTYIMLFHALLWNMASYFTSDVPVFSRAKGEWEYRIWVKWLAIFHNKAWNKMFIIHTVLWHVTLWWQKIEACGYCFSSNLHTCGLLVKTSGFTVGFTSYLLWCLVIKVETRSSSHDHYYARCTTCACAVWPSNNNRRISRNIRWFTQLK